MCTIKQLPKNLIEKIAAGEVVERPSSVVKELVENAIDASARSIVVDVVDGGKKRIAVIDDGSGMSPDDLKLCVLRHATSKISDESDLWKIRTMGFRGEALAAIGAVSKLTIESRINKPEIIEGAKIDIDGGEVKGPSVAGCPPGTKVVVSDLFFNVPARQKFLRSHAVEYGHIYECVTTLALAHPDIRFEISSNGKRQFISNAGDVKERVTAVLGDEIAGRLMDVCEEGGGIEIGGFVAESGRSGGKDVHIFLNKRPVRDKVLMHAVSAAFGERLQRGRYPAAALWIDIDPAKVDVNVHPTKREVRFAESGAVHDFVMSAVKKAVTSAPATIQTADKIPNMRQGVEAAINRFEERRLFDQASDCHPERSKGSPIGPLALLRAGGILPSTQNDARLHPIGQLGKTYIICEDADATLVIIDQHAAHERLGFDALTKQYSLGKVPEQRLLIPERVELGAKQTAYIMENSDAIARAGFEVEPFGGSTLMVKTVPALLGDANVGHVFEKMADELEELGSSHSIDDVVKRIFAVVACHRQVRAGDKLSIDELSALVRDIECENVMHCPHGRPAIVRIERGEIEKWFGRK